MSFPFLFVFTLNFPSFHQKKKLFLACRYWNRFLGIFVPLWQPEFCLRLRQNIRFYRLDQRENPINLSLQNSKSHFALSCQRRRRMRESEKSYEINKFFVVLQIFSFFKFAKKIFFLSVNEKLKIRLLKITQLTRLTFDSITFHYSS